MIINRHNYEEFFLLYVDDELAAEERSAVETFMQQNADLATEMDMLTQAKLEVEQVSFEQKELLYNQAEGVTLENYNEFFLLAVDKELSPEVSGEVEKFVLKHPELQSEFLLLQKTRLEPAEIYFGDKNKLYRQEVKERFMFLSPSWLKMGVAAAVIGLLFATWIITNKQDQGRQVAVSAPGPKSVKQTPQKPGILLEVPGKNLPVANSQKPAVSAVPVPTNKLAKKERHRSSYDDLAISRVKVKLGESTAIAGAQTAAKENVVSKLPAPGKDVVTVAAGNKNNLPVPGDVERPLTSVNDHQADYTSSLVKHVVYREIDNREEEEEKSFYIGSAEINKNKLKGFFKKAAGIFGKKNEGDGEHSLKIASFEIKSN